MPCVAFGGTLIPTYQIYGVLNQSSSFGINLRTHLSPTLSHAFPAKQALCRHGAAPDGATADSFLGGHHARLGGAGALCGDSPLPLPPSTRRRRPQSAPQALPQRLSRGKEVPSSAFCSKFRSCQFTKSCKCSRCPGINTQGCKTTSCGDLFHRAEKRGRKEGPGGFLRECRGATVLHRSEPRVHVERHARTNGHLQHYPDVSSIPKASTDLKITNEKVVSIPAARSTPFSRNNAWSGH